MARSVPTTIGNVQPLNLISPTQIGSTSWSKVSAGTSYSVGIRSDNTLYTWGLNSSGQIGLGDTINRSSPVLLSTTGISNFSAISAGLDHVVAITTDGRLYTWGNFAAISTLTVQQSWTQISYGGTHTLAIRNDGALFAWGNNAVGQLGDNTIISKSSPVQIASGSWSSVSAGTSHSMAISSNNLLFAWGLNNVGQLGLGTTVNKTIPFLIGTAAPADASVNNVSITRAGDTIMVYQSPFATGQYNITTYGGSCYFDGTGDWVNATVGAIGSGNFTIEFWCYQTLAGNQYYFTNGSSPDWGNTD